MLRTVRYWTRMHIRPIICTLVLPLRLPELSPSEAESTVINWKKVDQDRINDYQHVLQSSEQT